MARPQVENVNHRILRDCRKQIGLDLKEASKKISIKPDRLSKLESGEIYPTFKQLEKLAEVYCVPQWVFLRDKLADEYDFTQHMPAFRKFSQQSPIFDDYRTRVVTARVEQFRELILELRANMDEPVEPFSPPPLQEDFADMAASVRKWLDVKKPYLFKEWRQVFESKGIFVFLTSKFNHWSQLNSNVRGFSVYKEILPIIVINDSDTYKAQSFTLFHELGHLLRGESVMDKQQRASYSPTGTEKWCDQFAGEALMPRDAFLHKIEGITIAGKVEEYIGEIDKVANHFQVSRLACAMRMRQLEKITANKYAEVHRFLSKKNQEWKSEIKDKNIPFARTIHKEKLNQYGGIYCGAVVQAYRNQEIGLHKLCKLFGLKSATDGIQLEGSV